MQRSNMFIDSFKYYKTKNPSPNYENVIDVNSNNNNLVKKKITLTKMYHLNDTLGLLPIEKWEIFEFKNIPGLIFIQNPFTSQGQRYWILQCLKKYSQKPNKLNIDFEHILNDDENWWDVSFRKSDNKKCLINKLRWATLGYHHNWDTKIYSEASKSAMPEELSVLTKYVAEITGFVDFNAEAAIINYYRMNSTLAGHTDHSEMNIQAPLISISFGQSAIFLIGGLEKSDPANAMYLRSGDIIIMSGESRLRYHGVPRILKSDISPWLSQDEETNKDWENAKMYINEARINVNVRQVLQNGQTCL